MTKQYISIAVVVSIVGLAGSWVYGFAVRHYEWFPYSEISDLVVGSDESAESPAESEGAGAQGFSLVPVNPLSGPPPSVAYQTRCQVDGVGFDGWDSDRADLTLSITELGKPHSEWMSSYLFTEGNEFKVVQYARANDEIYAIKDGSFEA